MAERFRRLIRSGPVAAPLAALNAPQPGSTRRWSPGLAWPALAAGWALAAALLWLAGANSALWDWQPGLAMAEPWRALSCALLHWSGQHLALNLGGCALLALLGWRAGLGARAAAAWLLAWPLAGAGLLLRPDLLHYAGMSGLLHAGVAVVAHRLVFPGAEAAASPALRRHGALLAAGLALKIAWEMPGGPAVVPLPGADFALAPWGHLSGVLAGWLASLALGPARRAASS